MSWGPDAVLEATPTKPWQVEDQASRANHVPHLCSSISSCFAPNLGFWRQESPGHVCHVVGVLSRITGSLHQAALLSPVPSRFAGSTVGGVSARVREETRSATSVWKQDLAHRFDGGIPVQITCPSITRFPLQIWSKDFFRASLGCPTFLYHNSFFFKVPPHCIILELAEL